MFTQLLTFPVKPQVQTIILRVHSSVTAWLFSLMKFVKDGLSKMASLLLFTEESLENLYTHICVEAAIVAPCIGWGSWLWQYSVTDDWGLIMSALCHLVLKLFCRLAHLTLRLRSRCSHESMWQMRTLRWREVKVVAQCHTATQWTHGRSEIQPWFIRLFSKWNG